MTWTTSESYAWLVAKIPEYKATKLTGTQNAKRDFLARTAADLVRTFPDHKDPDVMPARQPCVEKVSRHQYEK